MTLKLDREERQNEEHPPDRNHLQCPNTTGLFGRFIHSISSGSQGLVFVSHSPGSKPHFRYSDSQDLH